MNHLARRIPRHADEGARTAARERIVRSYTKRMRHDRLVSPRIMPADRIRPKNLRMDAGSMTQQQSDEDLFAAALLIPAAERGGFLARACAHDPVVVQRLSGLLAAFDNAAHFVRTSALESQTAIDEIRSYRLLRELGEGGCGIAYLAEQLAPVRREVAIKVIKPGMDTKAVVARFEAERQLLALMDHPNVAKVFDAGSTAAGRPYFVMELVRGISITEYCDLLRLSIEERLQLFIQVCHGIQHAHHKGVMHRDIKPSNVLVTMHDGSALVKVIDFGIAKATQGPLSEQTFHTALEQFIGTPAYISPEQTELTQRNVDTRSDIYSLGVLLFELLTGCTPLDTEELMRSSAEEMRRRVREEEPPTASAKLRAHGRSTKDVQGDLDWIVMRCLEKEPGRRYQNVGYMISDLNRYLRHEPVEARPPSVPYLLAKFARRNRAACATILTATIIVIAFVTNMSIQAQRVAMERDRAEQQGLNAQEAAEFMLDTLSKTEPFGYADTGEPETVKELLDRTGRWLRQNVNQSPEVRARLLESVGRAYRRRDQDKEAVGFLQEALDLRTKAARGTGDVGVAQVMTELAICKRALDDVPASQLLLDEAADMLRRLGQEQSMSYARIALNRGRLAIHRGNPDGAKRQYDEALALIRDLRGARDPELAAVLVEKAYALHWRDDELPAAEQAAREATEIYSTALPRLHPDRVYAQTVLGEMLMFRNKLDEASRVLNEALIATRKIYGEHSRRTASVLDSLSRVARARRQFVQAESLATQSLEAAIGGNGRNHSSIGFYRIALAARQVEVHKYQEAEIQARTAIGILALTKPGHPHVASAQYVLGEALLGLNRPKDAEGSFRDSMNRLKTDESSAWRVARSASGLGESLYRQGRVAEAEAYLLDSYRVLAAGENADPTLLSAARDRLVRFYTERAQHDRLRYVLNTAEPEHLSHTEPARGLQPTSGGHP
jgi:eukaryotic-like serine/threonine-protein kinase